MKVGELIKIEGIRKWSKGDIITIKAGTGAGKSYFIKNMLYAFVKEKNKKILMLIHRTDCVNQFQREIKKDGKTNNIEIKTYQSLEYKIKNGTELDFSEYSYIVCDEFHYFMSDAAFNRTTDMSLNAILEQVNKIRIFMSATGDYMKRYINNFKKIETIDYELPINYDFIKKLTFFNKDETMEKFIEECIQSKDKAIFFIQSAKKAYELHKKYEKYTLFNCSESNKEYYKYVDKNKIAKMLSKEGFDEQILITTTTMDAGVNITDTNVKHVVCNVEDVGVLIQCIGRRRIDDKIKNDGIYVYIKNINNKQLGGRKTQTNNKIKKAECFKTYGDIEYVKKYGRDPDNCAIVYEEVNKDGTDTIKKLNEMAYFKSLIDIVTIDIMLNNSYITYISDLFNKKYRLIDEEYKKENLEKYLDNIVGKKLYKKEQKKLINIIDLKVHGRQQRSYSKLNEGLKMIKLPYIILPKKSNSRRFWVIEKIYL